MHGNENASITADEPLSRRGFVRMAGGLTVALAAAGLLGCGQAEGADAKGTTASGDAGKTAERAGSAPGKADAGTTPASAKDGQAGGTNQGKDGSSGYPRVTVVYFSATGHTEAIAQEVAKQLDVKPFTVVPATPYTSDDLNYNDSSSRVCTEHNDPARHVELADMQPEGFEDAFAAAEVVLLGYPIWWGGASWVLDDFVCGNDFTGKVVHPFCTSASSPVGSSADDLAELAATGDWQEGVRFAIGADEAAVADWLAGIDGLDVLVK